MCKIQDTAPVILHLARDLVFCIFRLAKSCLHTEEYFFPRETRNQMEDWN